MPDKRAGKGGNARKYGQNRRQPAKMHYSSANVRDGNKRRRITRMMKRFPKYKAVGWKVTTADRSGKMVRDK